MFSCPVENYLKDFALNIVGNRGEMCTFTVDYYNNVENKEK